MPEQWTAPPIRSHLRYCADLVYREEARHAEQVRANVPVLRSDLLRQGTATLVKKHKRMTGYEIHASMKMCFAAFDRNKDWRRLPAQVEFHEIAMESSLNNIYYNEADAEMSTILMQNNWTYPIRKIIALAVPRRCGKSTAVAMFAAVCAVTNPNRRIAIFSVTDRQAKLLHASILSFVTFLLQSPELDLAKKTGAQIVGDSKSELKIEFFGGQATFVNSYPASTDIRIAGRGVSRCGVLLASLLDRPIDR